MTQITQADRDRAGDVAERVYGERIADFIRSGQDDGHHIVQAFAAYRIAHQPQWQDIETAPKDGTWVWAYYPVKTFEDRQRLAQWASGAEGESRWIDSADYIDWTQPTHWQPLPSAPEQGAHHG